MRRGSTLHQSVTLSMAALKKDQLTIDNVKFDSARIDELVRMWRESFEFGVGVADPHPIAEQSQYLITKLIPNNTVRIAMSDGKLVGFIAATRDSISQLYVRKGNHRCGVGAQLLDWAKAQSSGSLWLYTFARNAVARAFYEKHGFRIVARGFEPTWQLADLRYEWKAQRAAV